MSSDTLNEANTQLNIHTHIDRIESQLSGVFLETNGNSTIKIRDYGVTGDSESVASSNGSSSIRVKRAVITTATDLSLQIQRLQSPPLSIISCCSTNSVTPLSLTKSMFKHILSTYEIDPGVMETMLCLGSRARTSETGMGNLVFRRNQDGTRELHYRLVYVEHVPVSGGDSWAIRQTVVIQKSWPESKRNLLIIFHPGDDDNLQDEIERQIIGHQDQMSHWCAVHLLIFSWYLPQWRRYLRHLGDRLDKAIDFALTVDMSRTLGMGEDPSGLQELYHLHDEIVCLIAWLKASTQILHELEVCNRQLTQDGGEDRERDVSNTMCLSHHIQRLRAYTDSANLMENRVSSTLKLLEVGIQQDNHRLASVLNRGMLGLAEASATDNVTIKTVTLVTLIFLPANLVAAVLGTNFFSSQNQSQNQTQSSDSNLDNNFSMSSKFWIFFAASVPLTLLTVGGWMLYMRISHANRRRNAHFLGLDGNC